MTTDTKPSTFYISAIQADGMTRSETIWGTRDGAEARLATWVERAKVEPVWYKPIVFAVIADPHGILARYADSGDTLLQVA